MALDPLRSLRPAPTPPLSFFLFIALLLTVLGPTGIGWAGEAGPWTVEDLVLREEASQTTVSADGRLAAWVGERVIEVEGAEQRVSNLWLARLDEATSSPLTRVAERASAPAFSPDTRYLAYLSNRAFVAPFDDPGKEARPQLWLVPLGGGEPFPLPLAGHQVRAFGWLDHQTLLVAAVESPSAWRRGRDEAKDSAQVVDDVERTPPVRLFRLGIEGSAQRLATDPALGAAADWIDQLMVSPEGRRVFVRSQQSLSWEFDQRTPPRAWWLELSEGDPAHAKWHEVLPEAGLLVDRVRWAPPEGAGSSSPGFYFVDDYSRHPQYRQATIGRLYYYDLGTGNALELDHGWDRGLGFSEYLPVEGGVLALLADGVHHRPALLLRSGGRRDLGGTHVRHLEHWAAPTGGPGQGAALVYWTSTSTTPPQAYVARLENDRLVDERQLTRMNRRYGGKPTGKVEVVHWQGAEGDTVEGLLHYPLDWPEEGGGGATGPRPLVLDIHGGPAGVDRDQWDFATSGPNLLWRQRGAFVLQVNYHGSAYYGLDWVESIAGHYYELEIPDIRRGVDFLVDQGLVDPERLAASGWSNGGILVADLITKDPRYKTAIVGAADVEWISDWANVDFGAAFDNYYFGGSPWEKTQVYLDKSPFFRLAEVRTPTLIHTGTEDRAVPPHQSWSLFRALQQMGNTQARLVLYPGEPHGLRRVAHQRRKVEEDVAWMERHLFATESALPGPPEIPPASPLAGLLARADAARVGAAFGRREGRVLVPETLVVEIGGSRLEVGRFEVTRVQWASFGQGERPAAGEENLPRTGIGFEDARDYVAWLAETTGRPFRLPTRTEHEALVKTAGKAGNTLDHWLGYTANPDDAATALDALTALGDTADGHPLLRPVGSFAPTDLGLFDLDGNAAEWTIEPGDESPGSGLALGLHAGRSTDPTLTTTPPAGLVGLRVVVGPVRDETARMGE